MITPSLPPSSDVGPDIPRSETLHDGSRLTIRPIAPGDAAAERRFIEGLSDQARRFRFLGQTRHPSDQLIRQLTDIDYVHDFALIALPIGDDRIVGVSRYSTNADGTQCECAVTVDDEWQNRGLGTMLMEQLIRIARNRGIRSMYSIDSAENRRMQELAGHLGFRTRCDTNDASQVVHELSL